MYVFVALVIQHVTRVRHIVICCLSGSAIFFHIIPTHGTIFGEKNDDTENMCFDFL